jgi:hypothetical protein
MISVANTVPRKAARLTALSRASIRCQCSTAGALPNDLLPKPRADSSTSNSRVDRNNPRTAGCPHGLPWAESKGLAERNSYLQN